MQERRARDIDAVRQPVRLRRNVRCVLTVLVGMLSVGASVTPAAEVADARALYRTGKYAECIAACKTAIGAGETEEAWWLYQLRAELTTGQYTAALDTYAAATARMPRSIQIRMLGRQVLQNADRPGDADKLTATIIETVVDSPWRFGAAADRVTFGRALLLGGEDARGVLDQIYAPAKKADPSAPEPYLASGEMALDKSDFALAAEAFEAAVKFAPDDPDLYLGLAKAYDSDAKRASAALEKALTLNPRHVDSLLFRAADLIDREAYAEAQAILKQVIEINPREPGAWSYRAVLAHLNGDAPEEKAARAEALGAWRTNPMVDHLIGLKLSQKYRFAEGRAYQQQALAVSPTYLPAQVQLCQDLLRLGEEQPGWRMADAVLKADPYNVLAFNLTTLRDSIKSYRVLRQDRLAIRMEPREADLYGRRVSDLLVRARDKLAKKYDIEMNDDVFVEIFAKQKDFAIRTFGLPGGAGYLGVCFGNVITVNSPASRVARPANWEAVLWHEFCHAVTLRKTRNKMPRWLSEGISVYEERLENPTWGQTMNPAYRQIILAGKTTPVSQLSGAFLKATTPMDVQFAYFESSMVVRYVVDRHGIGALRSVLKDLGDNVPINDALARYTVPIDQLDKAFDAWLRTEAEGLAAGADLSREDFPLGGSSQVMAEWNRARPNNVWGLLAEGQALLAEEKWQAALVPLQQAAALYPTYGEADSPYVLMAAAYRELKDAKAERAMLGAHAALSADAVEPRLRLLDLAAADGDWADVKKVALDVLAINPLVASPHRFLARAAEAMSDRPTAIEARQALLVLDPLDPSGQHYHLAKLLAEERQFDSAKRHVLQSLEETPRYRDAHRLLLDITARRPPTTPPTTPPATAPARKDAIQ